MRTQAFAGRVCHRGEDHDADKLTHDVHLVIPLVDEQPSLNGQNYAESLILFGTPGHSSTLM
jgi:hypothetical protein